MKLPQFPGLDDIAKWWTPKPEFAFAGAASGLPRTSSASTPKGGSFLFSSGSGSGGSDDDGGYDDEEYYEEEPQQTRRPAGAQRRQAPAPANQGGGSGSGGGRQRTVQYQPEERYWTEYLRIALPILGLLLMIALLWFWALQLTGDDNGNDPLETPVGTTEVITPPTAEPTTEPTDEVVVPPTTEAEPQTTPVADEETPVDEPPVDEIAIGAVVTVTDDGVNMRADATTDSEAITQLDPGDVLEVTDGPFEGDNYVWWEVTVEETGEIGYVAVDFLEVMP